MASDGVRIEAHSGLGKLLAAKDFKAGDVVVYERPLLFVPQLKPSNPVYKPLQAYFEQNGIPASVVLKIMAYFTAEPETQAKVLHCTCPDPEAFAEAAVVKQAKLFAQLLIDHPPVPEFKHWTQEQQQQSSSNSPMFNLIVKIWLIWITNGHSFRLGSALFEFGSKLTHTCAAPNTAYCTAGGDAAPVHGLASSSGSSNAAGQLPARPAAAAASTAAAAAGYHVALGEIKEGDVLKTNYLGLGHKRLLSTPVRQKILHDTFLFKCTCARCTQEVDLARGIPCPECSANHRAQDKLLKEDIAIQPSSSGSSSSSVDQPCGYIYCDVSKQLAGDDKPWQCDKCGVTLEDETAEIWGRWYTRSHDHIERDMEGWVLRFDESLDTAPLIREPSTLHDRIVGIVRLLGPRHWASWRLLLLGVELHCGVLEQAVVQFNVSPSQPPPTEAAAAAAAPSSAAGPPQQQQQQQRAADTAARLSGWGLRYCQTVWSNVSYKYGEVEAGQLLGYHFTEAAQVLLQVASTPGLSSPSAAEALMDSALQLQQQVLPGLRSLMGDSYSPMGPLVQNTAAAAAASPTAAAAAAGGGVGTSAAGSSSSSGQSAGKYVAASVKRYLQQQAAEKQKVQQVVAELQQLETSDASQEGKP